MEAPFLYQLALAIYLGQQASEFQQQNDWTRMKAAPDLCHQRQLHH